MKLAKLILSIVVLLAIGALGFYIQSEWVRNICREEIAREVGG